MFVINIIVIIMIISSMIIISILIIVIVYVIITTRLYNDNEHFLRLADRLRPGRYGYDCC